MGSDLVGPDNHLSQDRLALYKLATGHPRRQGEEHTQKARKHDHPVHLENLGLEQVGQIIKIIKSFTHSQKLNQWIQFRLKGRFELKFLLIIILTIDLVNTVLPKLRLKEKLFCILFVDVPRKIDFPCTIKLVC